MKKLTLSIGLVAAILSAKAQDTTCTYFYKKRVIEFDYQTSEILKDTIQSKRFFDITVKYGDVLCLDLNDESNKLRKVITTYFDGSTREDILDSKDNIYYSPQGTIKVSVGKSKYIIAGKPPRR